MELRGLTDRRRWLALLATVVITVLGATAASARADSYVSLGDSYTAGPVLPNQIGPPYGCL